jgi:hypothetical protein
MLMRLGVERRVRYVCDVHLPSLLKKSLGLITINSTTGLQALFHAKPVKVMGSAIYDIPRSDHPKGSSMSFGVRLVLWIGITICVFVSCCWNKHNSTVLFMDCRRGWIRPWIKSQSTVMQCTKHD